MCLCVEEWLFWCGCRNSGEVCVEWGHSGLELSGEQSGHSRNNCRTHTRRCSPVELIRCWQVHNQAELLLPLFQHKQKWRGNQSCDRISSWHYVERLTGTQALSCKEFNIQNYSMTAEVINMRSSKDWSTSVFLSAWSLTRIGVLLPVIMHICFSAHMYSKMIYYLKWTPSSSGVIFFIVLYLSFFPFDTCEAFFPQAKSQTFVPFLGHLESFM